MNLDPCLLASAIKKLTEKKYVLMRREIVDFINSVLQR
jgi:hypothetical protein